MCYQFVQEQVNECTKLSQVNAVPEVMEITETILLHLHEFEEDEETLGEEAENVAEVLNQQTVHCNRKDEWTKESKDI